MNSNLKLGYGMMAIWGSLAIIGDLVSLMPFVGDFVGPVFFTSFAIFLWMKGFGFLKPGRLAVEIIDSAIKMIPVLQEIPIELLVGTAAIMAMIKFDEKTNISLQNASKPKQINNSRTPNNYNGRREPVLQNDQDEQSAQIRNSHIAPPPLNVGGMRMPVK